MARSGLALGAVAGEKSGDLLAAGVLAALARAEGGLDARGIGGPSMAEAGFERWWDIEALSVNGYAEVLREYPRLRRMREELKRRMVEWRPDVFLGVDAPDFNLNVEKRMREAGVPVVHFIGPSIWAWRAGRIDRIRESVDHMLLVFPFEKEIYDKAGIPSTYVGHPLADAIPRHVDRAAAPRRAELALGLVGAGPLAHDVAGDLADPRTQSRAPCRVPAAHRAPRLLQHPTHHQVHITGAVVAGHPPVDGGALLIDRRAQLVPRHVDLMRARHLPPTPLGAHLVLPARPHRAHLEQLRRGGTQRAQPAPRGRLRGSDPRTHCRGP